MSEQGFALTKAQIDHKQFHSDQVMPESTTYYDGRMSHDYEANSGIAIRAGSGLNYSDSAARTHFPKPPLA